MKNLKYSARRIMAGVLVVCAILSMHGAAFAEARLESAELNSHEKGETVTIYEQPTMNSEIIAMLYSGIGVSAEHTAEEWTAIDMSDGVEMHGYVLSENLEWDNDYIGVAYDLPFAEILPKTESTVVLYESPQENASAKGIYVEGVILRIMGYVDDYALVKCGGETGYLKASFLKEKEGDTSQQVFPAIEEPAPTYKNGEIHLYMFPDKTDAPALSFTDNDPQGLPSFEVIADIENWYQIQLVNGTVFFMEK